MLFTLLAQVSTNAASTSAAAPEALAVPTFQWTLWAPSTHEVLRGTATMAGTLLAGLVILLVLRGFIRRVKLGPAAVVGIIALAIYLGALAYKPDRFLAEFDHLAFYISRLFAGAMVFVALRLMDRLVIVPLLTRGGRVTLPRFFHQIIVIVIALFALVIYGSLAFGWDIDRFLAGSAVVSIVLGLALQESLGNFFSGLVMQASPPFGIGDWIICGEFEGRVVDMTWRAVTLQTNEDNFIVIPNAKVAQAEITNFHAPTTACARYVKVGLDYSIPPAEALAVLKSAALESAWVQANPEPYVFMEDFADSAVVYSVKFYIIDPPNEKEAESDVRVHLWYRLRQKGYNIPFPIRTVEHASAATRARDVESSARARHLKAIESVPLLAPMSVEQKTQLSGIASDVLLAPGQFLFRQDDSGNSFYIIVRGQVEVLVTPHGSKEQRKVATLGPGDFFGEMSALTGQPRTATIRAISSLALVEIEKEDLLSIFKADPAIMEKISEVVARRNAEREAVLQGAGAAPTQEIVVHHQKTLLGRMINFFRLGAAA